MSNALRGGPIVVLGMYRGGTSSIAGALAGLGVYFGADEDLFPADTHNEEGYWEHRWVTDLNRRFLMSLNLAAFDVDPVPADWLQRPMSETFLAEMQVRLERYFSGKPLWGWKDPETSILLPFTKTLFERIALRPHYVICVRHPLDVASSQERRSGTPRDHTLGSWLRHTLFALRETIGEARTVVMHDDFLEQPRTALEATVNAVADWSPSEEVWRSAASTVRPDLVHFRRTAKELDGLPVLFQKTYDLCREAASAPDRLQGGALDARIEACHAELVQWMSYLRPNPAPSGLLRLVWEQGTRGLEATLPFAPTRGWQVLRLAVKAAPGVRLAANFYHLPCAIWIRRAAWHVGGREVPARLQAGENGLMSEEAGTPCLWGFPGPAQAILEVPSEKGPFELELEVMFELTPLVTGMAFRRLSQTDERAPGR